MINELLESLYCNSLNGLSELYEDLDSKGIVDYVGPLLTHCWEEEYNKSKHRLMILGQETNGWYSEYMRTEKDVKTYMDKYRNFKLGEEYNSLFWQYAHEINRMINGTDNLNFIWNNVNKFGIDGKGKPHPDVLQNELMHYNILSKEIAILCPDVCIFLSGPNYDVDLKGKFPDIRLTPIDGYSINEAARLISSFLPRNSFRIYHPGYGNRYQEWYMELLHKISSEIDRHMLGT